MLSQSGLAPPTALAFSDADASIGTVLFFSSLNSSFSNLYTLRQFFRYIRTILRSVIAICDTIWQIKIFLNQNARVSPILMSFSNAYFTPFLKEFADEIASPKLLQSSLRSLELRRSSNKGLTTPTIPHLLFFYNLLISSDTDVRNSIVSLSSCCTVFKEQLLSNIPHECLNPLYRTLLNVFSFIKLNPFVFLFTI